MEIAPHTVRNYLLPELREVMSPTDYRQIEALTHIFAGDSIFASLGAALRQTFGKDDTDAMALLRNLRSRLKAASAGLNGLEMGVDTKKQSKVDDRRVWFSAPDATMARIRAQGVEGLTAGHDSSKVIAARAIPTTSEKLLRGEVSRGPLIVVLYADKDKKEALEFIEELSVQFRAANAEVTVWHTGLVPFGGRVSETLASYLERANFTVALMSQHLLGDKGLRAILETNGTILPILPIQFRTLSPAHTLGSLDGTQMRPPRGEKAYLTCTKYGQEQWAGAIAQELLSLLRGERAFDCDIPAGMKGGSTDGFTPPMAKRTRSIPKDESELVGEKGEDALAALEKWLADPKGSRYCAVLGEYGIGKTTLLRELAAKCHRHKGEMPTAIYIDLRSYNETVKQGRVPVLEEFLKEQIDREWRSGEAGRLAPRDILRMVRDEGAILIFDGLDEKLVHLDQAQGLAFIRTLWGALPPDYKGKNVGRLIFSCRSHYFPTLNQQASMLTGEGRDGLRREDYLTLLLLPFTEAQVRSYLGAILGEQKVEGAMELIAAIHNLSELSKRPYLLSLIASQIGKLEEQRMRGETVRSVDLYKNMTADWLNRDSGKHFLRDGHKLRLMSELAVAMWRSGAREWPWERVDRWLTDRVADDKTFRYVWDKPELLAEDFRTATFVLRPDTSADQFQFAHTSLQEYFLAIGLVDSLHRGEAATTWALPVPSDETFSFIGEQIEKNSERPKIEEGLKGLLSAYFEDATENAFRYWLLARTRRLPAPVPARFDLTGAKLTNWTIAGSAGDRLPMAGAILAKAHLIGAKLTYVNMAGALLFRTRLEGTEWEEFSLDEADLTEAKAFGASFRHGSLCPATTTHAEGAGVCCVESTVNEKALAFVGVLSHCRFADDQAARIPNDLESPAFLLRPGHRDWVNSCVFSPDGHWIVSGGRDGAVKVWDARTGALARTLEGQQDWIQSCGFSPDGRWIVSGGRDGTVKVWDVLTGALTRTLKGQQDWIQSCGFSPDGRWIVSGGWDGRLKVWDAQTGALARAEEGSLDRVNSYGSSPDERWIVSGGSDGTVKVWEAQTGALARTLGGQQGWVESYGASPDGHWIVSGGSDGTLMMWNADTGALAKAMEGHHDWVLSCAFSPDGLWIVSGGSDGTLMVWNADTGTLAKAMEGHKDSVNSCGFSLDSRWIISASRDGTLKVWDAQTGALAMTLEGQQGWVESHGTSPDGHWIVSGGSDGTLRVWNAETGALERAIEGHPGPVSSCAFSPDSRRIISGSRDSTLKVWDVQAGTIAMVLHGQQGSVRSCNFSPDGHWIVSGGSDGTVKVWDAETRAQVRILEGHQGAVSFCTFSPDGRWIISGSRDGTVKVWDSRSGDPLLALTIGEADEYVVVDDLKKCVVSLGRNSWRKHLHAAAYDPAEGRVRSFPPEHFWPEALRK